MFKRYKNPFEKEQSSSFFEEEDSSVSLAQKHNYSSERPLQNYQKNPSKDEYAQDIPPRMFSTHPGQQQTAIRNCEHDEILAQQEVWDEKKHSEHKKTAKKNSLCSEEPETTLGEGVSFKGELTFKSLLRIDGRFEGELISDGKLIIGPSGVVKSNVKLHEAVVEGYVEGNMEVKERIELRGDAQVHGDIQTKFLSMDEGVTVIGSIIVTPKETSETEKSEEKLQNKK